MNDSQSLEQREQALAERETAVQQREQELTEREARVEARESTIDGVTVLGIIVVVVIVCVLILALGWTFVEATKLQGEGRLRLIQTSIAGIAGIGLAVLASWRAWGLDQQVRQGRAALEAAERKFADERERARKADEQAILLRLDQQFSDATKLLGNEKIATRIGGLLTLERLLQDQAFETERWTIIQLLECFVRERCSISPETASPTEDKQRTKILPQDAQVALTIIGRRPDTSEPRGLDFHGLDLRGLCVPGAKLERVNFCRARLDHADLSSATLNFANFLATSLTAVDFSKADMQNADFRYGNLTEAIFENATLCGAQFDRATIVKSLFSKANLAQTCFAHAKLTDVAFLDANLESAHLKNSQNKSVDFSGSKLDGTLFHHAKLDDSNLIEVTGRGTTFSAATLTNTCFNGARLAEADFIRAELDDVMFQDSILAAPLFVSTTLKTASFNDAQLERPNFLSAQMVSDVVFERATLIHPTFENADLSGAVGIPDHLLPNNGMASRGDEAPPPEEVLIRPSSGPLV